jgi:hypothetical protein
MHVCEEKGKRGVFFGCPLDGSDGLRAVGRSAHFVTLGFKHPQDQLEQVGFIVHHEDPMPLRLRFLRAFSRGSAKR